MSAAGVTAVKPQPWGERIFPRSLFGRLILLLVTVVGLVALTTFLLFNRDRAALLASQFNDTKLVQMKALRASLEGADGPQRRETLARLGREYGVRIVPESERPTIGIAPIGPAMHGLQERLREGLGEATEVRISPRARQLFVHMRAGSEGYWIGFALPPRQEEEIPTRLIALSAAVIGLSTATESGTLLPLSISGGTSSFTRPLRSGAPPVTFRTASCIAAGVARAGRDTVARPMPPAAAIRNSRREVIRTPSAYGIHAMCRSPFPLSARERGKG